jgi:hypothetical protein
MLMEKQIDAVARRIVQKPKPEQVILGLSE